MTDDADIRETVAAYVTAMARGDRRTLLDVFHDKAVSVGHYGGGLEWDGIEAFADSCVAVAIPSDEPIPPWDIENVFRSGDTAVVICRNHWAGEAFRDSLTLLKGTDRWRIVFKCFHHLS